MSVGTDSSTEQRPRDAGNWAEPVSRLSVSDAPAAATNLNVDGRQVVGPLQGFGQLWQKTYYVALTGAEITPAEVVEAWKAKLPEFMPSESRFYPSVSGVAPGEVVLINATLPGIPGGVPVSTGVLILYADDVSFTVMTPEGHPESGFNTFSAHRRDGSTVAQIQSLGRANDPMYEIGYRFMGGAKQQEKIWQHVLTSLSALFGADGQVQMKKTCIDTRMQWSQAKNIWHNAIIRTVLNTPARLVRKTVTRDP
jgi:hypothetical protein